MAEKFKNYLIPLAIVIAGLIIAGALIYLNQGKVKTPALKEAPSSQEIAKAVIDYINKNIPAAKNSASLIEVSEAGEALLKIRLKIGESEYESYATKDGKFLFPEGYNLEETQEEASVEGETTPPQTQKKEVPDVKLFVMSYCPYGLQTQKVFLPVYNLLKDKAEMGVYFVNYIMHGKKEIDENLRQYCIQKEQEPKFYDYLSCFTKTGDSETCLSQAGVDQVKITTCVEKTDQEYNITSQYNDKSTWLNGRFPKFDVHSNLCQKYGVRGSPTIVINDKVVEVSPRSPEKFKEVICQAFSSPPSECSQELSNTAFSPGFGLKTGSSGGGQCK